MKSVSDANTTTVDWSKVDLSNPATLPFNIPPSAVPKHPGRGFTTLPIHLEPFDDFLAEPIFHYCYIRPHDPQYTPIINAHPNINGRSLFATSIPFDSTLHHFRALFSAIGGGRVETVIFSDEPLPPRQISLEENRGIKSKKRKRSNVKPVGTKEPAETAPWPSLWNRKLHPPDSTAVIVFVDQAACELAQKALEANSTDNPRMDYFWGAGIGEGNRVPELGLERYLDHAQRVYPDEDVLQSWADASLEAYDRRIAAEEEAHRRKANEPDEDGFVTVVRSTKPRLPPSAEEIAEQKKKEDEKAKKGLYKDFYRFQQREVKKEQAQKLLSQFQNARKTMHERKQSNT